MDAGSRSWTYTVEEAAGRLGIGRTLAYELIRRGEFPVPAIRLGRRIVVSSAALDALLGHGATAGDDERESRRS